VKPHNVRLFVKPYCPWCHQARDWLDARGIAYELSDVISDPHAYREMVALSGQSYAPVIVLDGRLLADFDTGQLERFWCKWESEV
jgi:glutaredoxin